AVTHNVMIVSPDKRFYNALPTLLFRPSVCAGQPSKKPPSMAAWRDQIVEQICTRSLRRCRTRYRLRWPRRISSQDELLKPHPVQSVDSVLMRAQPQGTMTVSINRVDPNGLVVVRDREVSPFRAVVP